MRLAVCVLAALLAAPVAFAHTDGPEQLSFAWPADGTVTSPFGIDNGRWHPGLDIGSLRSLDVTAAAPGRVVEVGEPYGFFGYGEIVEVNVGGGYDTLYAHLARPLARVGETIAAGDRIGIAGCTGFCTGTHLHFELRHAGVAVDPTLLMTGYNPAPQGG
jgi:murein DD-endopeptidase MepM/ murein hydrolase activator NlpD